MLADRMHFGRSVAAATALAILFCVGASSVGAQSTGMSTRYSKTFNVSKAPDGPWDVYVTDTIVPPGAWTGPHTHPGPEFGLIASGEATRWDLGLQTRARSGAGYYSATNVMHEGGNTSTEDALQMSVHLIPKGGLFAVNTAPDKVPAGAPQAVLTSKRIWQAKYELATHPAVPLSMVQKFNDMPAGGSTTYKQSQLALVSVVSGSLDVTQNGKTTTYGAGGKWIEQPGDMVAIANGLQAPASTFVVLLAASKK